MTCDGDVGRLAKGSFLNLEAANQHRPPVRPDEITPTTRAIPMKHQSSFAARNWRSRHAVLLPLILAAFATMPSLAFADHFRVFLLGGQSNMAGRGPEEDLQPPFEYFNEDVWIWLDFSSLQSGGHFMDCPPTWIQRIRVARLGFYIWP